MTDAGAERARLAVDAGLQNVLDHVAVGHGYAQLFGGYDAPDGLYARAEAGYHLAPNLAAFGFGEASQTGGVIAGAGIRVGF